ncbi:PAS domain-containing sensor histidine kinase [Alkalihalobacterium elongatum]|uniref:PAS domain-containing sensor histidine kinase n=1 Tax=Alkalihalobacterium elongatum TaxID=2675466 RepID=UPI001C1FAC23|nr:PAS domain-containing sensor histidine kinase [Alkalihalobacterium elongatum]
MDKVDGKDRWLNDFIDNLHDPFFILDEHGICKYLNKATEKLFLKPRQSILKKVIWHEPKMMTYTSLYIKFQEVISTGENTQFELFFERTLTWYNVEIYSSANQYAVHFHNITSSKKKIERTMQCCNSLFDYHPDAVHCLDLKGNFLAVNKSFEEIFGYTEDEALNRNFRLVVHEDDLERTLYHFENVKNQIPQNFDITCITKQGEKKSIHITITPVIINKNVVAVFGIAQDISDQIRAQQTHIKSEKLSFIGELAAGIAHEINNPLTTIKGFLQLWKEGSIYYPDHYSIFESELDRIALLSNELLTLGKPLSQQMKIIDIAVVLQEVTRLFQKEAELKNIDISCNTKENTYNLFCNEVQIKQLFFNIIENGIDAMDRGGKLVIEATLSNNEVVISISDEGKGIPPEILNRIGEPFYTTKEKGTGLGLMVCYGIVNQYNGEINVTSRINSGTTFSIKLPLANTSGGVND